MSGWAFIGAVSETNAGAVYVYQVTSAEACIGGALVFDLNAVPLQ